ncbi:MAG: complex I subunit 1/NuoH family protein, partial [Bacteroidia bacterium]
MFLIIQIIATFTFIAVYTLFAVYAERKVSAYIQDRLGPMEVGPHGLFQTAADILKLILKENIIPTDADKWIFSLAPLVIFVFVFVGFATLPIGPTWIGADTQVGLFFILAVIAIDVIGILMAGWGSNNKYAFIGASRAVAQIISYEIPAAFALLAGVMMYGTLDLQQMSIEQGIFTEKSATLWHLFSVEKVGGITTWAIIRYPHLLIAFFIYFIASLAECNRAPFDIPEAESELVAGFHVEYTGSRFAIIFLAEYGKMLLVSGIAVFVFLGGWNTPLPNLNFGAFQLPLATWTSGTFGELSANLWGLFWLICKLFGLIFIQMWIRW